ncbi:CvpA family protein [Mariprofundus ferrooxydans]|uniref:CvpA family protein n=1 Tax=Mariprofundus ferrooxydans TaxID=314344 RepID=UPI000381C59B|nr:CvpA family protein [Mariprofundus ferrooxydans]
MDFLILILAFLSLGAFIAAFVGLIKPSLLRQQNRVQAFGKAFGAFIAFVIIFSIISPNDKQEVASKPAPTVSKEIMVDPNNINALDVDISLNNFSPNIAEIRIKKDENYYTVVIDKTSLKKGFEWKNNDNKWGNYDSWQVKAFAYFNGDNYILAPVPECNGKCYVTLKIIEFDEAHKRAVINISVKLLNETKYIASKHLEKKNVEIIGFDNLEIEIINTNKKPYFNNLIYMESNKPQEDEELNLVLTDSIKADFNTFEKMLLHIKKKAQELEEVTSTQPMGRGESGSLYVAKWNGNARKWSNKAETKISASPLNKFKHCQDALYKTKMAISDFSLLNLRFVPLDNKVNSLSKPINSAQLELAKCKARFNQ